MAPEVGAFGVYLVPRNGAIMRCLEELRGQGGSDRMTRWPTIGLAAVSLQLATAGAAQVPPPLHGEESEIATLPAPEARWVFASSQWGDPGTRIFDGTSGRMVGTVHHGNLASFAIDPLGKYYYIAETIWTRGNRGTRQDMITVYDSHTLKLVREIKLPGRLLVGFRTAVFSISGDGRQAYVYNMDPASSVVVVDLAKGSVATNVELPGCGLSVALPGKRFMSLCSDGTVGVTSTAGTKGVTSYSEPFFSAELDPIYDSSDVDPVTGQATFLTYSGMLRTADLSTGINLSEPWSLQEAAGLPKGSAAPLLVNWFPGGRQPIAVHYASKRAFVLMHKGEYWSQKEAGEEIWVLDLATRKLLARHEAAKGAISLAISQDAEPVLFVGGMNEIHMVDPNTFEEAHDAIEVGGVLYTAGARN